MTWYDFTILISGGYMKSSGVMYLKFKDNFKQSAVATAWIFSLYTTFLLMLGTVPPNYPVMKEYYFSLKL